MKHWSWARAFIYLLGQLSDFDMTGREPISLLGLVLGISLSLFILGILAYALARWYREGQCWHRPNFVFNLYHIRNLKSVQVELAPPFTISGSMREAGGSYMRFHDSAT